MVLGFRVNCMVFRLGDFLLVVSDAFLFFPRHIRSDKVILLMIQKFSEGVDRA